MLNGRSLLSVMDPLKAIVHDVSADSDVRLRAAARLMVIADAELDRALADHLYAIATELPPKCDQGVSSMMRVELVYHTAFGKQERAIETAHEILERFPEAEFDEASYRARSYAGFFFYRMNLLDSALHVFESTYSFMNTRAATGYSVYAATMCADISVSKGDFGACKCWIARTHIAAQRSISSQFIRSIGLPSVEAELAIIEGRYTEADELIANGRVEHLGFLTERHKATALSQSIRLQLARESTSSPDDVHQLRRHYQLGQSLGGQDAIVSALWAADILSGDEHGATSLLLNYLFHTRRELGAPEWLLSHTTGADDCWAEYQRVFPT